MASITVDQLQVLITANAKDLDAKLAQISRNMGGMSKDTSQAGGKMSAAFEKVGGVAVKALKIGAVGAIGAVAASIPGAVKRIDTLVAFPRVLEAMGASSEEAAKATDTLAKRLSGLPTPLQEGASGVQALVAAGLSVEDATDTFLAFNNATLAASTEAGAAQGAFTQLVQSISKGKIEGQEWNSIVAAMPTAFQALSKQSGKTREELRELYRTNPQKLLDDLKKLDKEGGGGLASLEDQARAATGGIGTAFANMRNSITRGIENIVRSIGDGGTDTEKLASGQRKISAAIAATGKAFGDVLSVIAQFIVKIIEVTRSLSDFASENKGLIQFFVGLFGAIALFAGLAKITAIVTTFGAALKAAVYLSPASVAAISGLPAMLGTVAVAMSGLTATFLAAGGGFAGFQALVIAGLTAIKGAAIATFTTIMAHPLILTFTGIVAGLTFTIGGLVSAFQQVDEATRISTAYTTIMAEAQERLKLAVDGVATAELTLKEARLAEADAQIAYTQAIKNQEQATRDLAAATEATGITYDNLKTSVDNGSLSYQEMTAEQRRVYDAGLALDSSNAKVEASHERVGKAAKDTKDATAELTQKQKDLATEAIATEAANLVMQGAYKTTEEALKHLKEEGVSYTDSNGKQIDIAKGDFDELKDKAGETSRGMVKDFRDAKSGADQGFFGPMGVSLSKAGGWFGDLASKAGQKLGEMTGKAGKEAGNTKTALKDKLGNLGSEASGWGGNITTGLANGISAGAGKIKSVAGSIASWIKSTFESAMDINSPSGVFEYYGDMITRGLSGGIDGGTRDVMSSMKDLANLSVGSFDSSVNVQHGFSDFTNGNTQPLIINVGGERLVDTVIEGINGRSFLGGSSVINV